MLEKRIVMLAFVLLAAFGAIVSASTVSILIGASLAATPEVPPGDSDVLPGLPPAVATFHDLIRASKRPPPACEPAPKVRLLATLVGDTDAHAVIELEGTVRLISAGDPFEDSALWEIARGGATLKRACDSQALSFDAQPIPAVAAVNLNVDETLNNLDQLAKNARFVPKMTDGVMSLKIMAIRPGSIFETGGLKNGDVIKSVDGRPLEELARFGAIHELRSRGSVRVELEREGAKMFIPVNLY